MLKRKRQQKEAVAFDNFGASSSSESSDDEQAELVKAGREAARRARQEAKKQKQAHQKREAALPHPNDRPRKTVYKNKQRTLVFSTRGISGRDRHLMEDLRDLMPHAKKDSKLDTKTGLNQAVNELCEMKNCNNCVLFEARKRKDLYMWVSRTPNGPSAKFHVQNVHTMAELKLTGNCLKGSRPVCVFDKSFDAHPQFALLKEMFIQVFGSPRGHPKTKPFVDHVFSWFIADNRIWFRNYQIVYDGEKNPKKKGDPVLVEVGPRFVLNPIKIFDGSFSGSVLFDNPDYVSPNQARRNVMLTKQDRYTNTRAQKEAMNDKILANILPKPELEDVFNTAVASDYESEESEDDDEDDE